MWGVNHSVRWAFLPCEVFEEGALPDVQRHWLCHFQHIIVDWFVLWSVVFKSILSFDHLVSSRVAWIEKVNLAILCPFCNSFALLLHHFLPIVHHFCIIFTSFVGADEKHFRELQHINVPVMLMPDDFRAFSKIKIDNHAFNKENLPSHFKVRKCVNPQQNWKCLFISGQRILSAGVSQPEGEVGYQ